ncbi:MAG: hypothetical protein C4523_08490 [Myxococcales bacterium]|nr:MAG: hypothetical protein C4523_08490 [Myxococcales bacterium]
MTTHAKRPYTFWWYFQRFSGVVILFTLLAHWFMVHFRLERFEAVSLKPEEVAERYADPLMALFYAVFLLMAIPHGVNGVLNVIDDYIRHDFWRMAATWAAWLLGVVVFLYGFFTLV